MLVLHWDFAEFIKKTLKYQVSCWKKRNKSLKKQIQRAEIKLYTMCVLNQIQQEQYKNKTKTRVLL